MNYLNSLFRIHSYVEEVKANVTFISKNDQNSKVIIAELDKVKNICLSLINIKELHNSNNQKKIIDIVNMIKIIESKILDAYKLELNFVEYFNRDKISGQSTIAYISEIKDYLQFTQDHQHH